MSNRPDPEMFARYSYYLAFVSGGIIILSFLIAMIQIPIATVLVNVIWLALISGAAGTFMGWAATSDFKRVDASTEARYQARVGFRINLGTIVVLILMAILGIVTRFLTSSIVVQ